MGWGKILQVIYQPHNLFCWVKVPPETKEATLPQWGAKVSTNFWLISKPGCTRWRSMSFLILIIADVGGGKRWRSRRHLEVRIEKQFFPTFIKRDTAHNKNAEFLFSSDGQTARLGNLRSGTWRDMGEDWKIENCQSYQNCRYEYIYASLGIFCLYRWGNQPDSNGGANEDCLQFYWSKRDRWSITYSLLIIHNSGWWNELCILFLSPL